MANLRTARRMPRLYGAKAPRKWQNYGIPLLWSGVWKPGVSDGVIGSRLFRRLFCAGRCRPIVWKQRTPIRGVRRGRIDVTAGIDSLKTRRTLKVGNRSYDYFRIKAAETAVGGEFFRQSKERRVGKE